MLSSDNMEYSTCYTMMTYTLSQKPDGRSLWIQNLAECDQSRPKESETPDSGSCGATVVGIIGGADGPTAICIGTPHREREFAASWPSYCFA